MSVCLVFMTAPDEPTAARLARTVVEERHAACGNIISGIRSIYRWNDNVQDESEVLVLFKTTDEAVDGLRERIVAIHPYECPEVLVVPAGGGHLDYLQWVADSVGSKNI